MEVDGKLNVDKSGSSILLGAVIIKRTQYHFKIKCSDSNHCSTHFIQVFLRMILNHFLSGRSNSMASTCIGLIVLVNLFSCTYDYECKDLEYGRQLMLESTKELFAYSGGERLIFKDSSNHELTFDIIPSHGIYPVWLKMAQEVKEGSCTGQSKIRSELELLVVNFNSDSLDYYIVYFQGVHTLIDGSQPIFFDIMSASITQGSTSPVNWYMPLHYLMDSRGNDAYFMGIPISDFYEESIILNGKQFSKVYYNTQPDGGAFYFNHDLGFVGFKEPGPKPLWVLDRIE